MSLDSIQHETPSTHFLHPRFCSIHLSYLHASPINVQFCFMGQCVSKFSSSTSNKDSLSFVKCLSDSECKTTVETCVNGHCVPSRAGICQSLGFSLPSSTSDCGRTSCGRLYCVDADGNCVKAFNTTKFGRNSTASAFGNKFIRVPDDMSCGCGAREGSADCVPLTCQAGSCRPIKSLNQSDERAIRKPTRIVLPCPNDCSGHGVCDKEAGECECVDGYRGVACEVREFTPLRHGNHTLRNESVPANAYKYYQVRIMLHSCCVLMCHTSLRYRIISPDE